MAGISGAAATHAMEVKNFGFQRRKESKLKRKSKQIISNHNNNINKCYAATSSPEERRAEGVTPKRVHLHLMPFLSLLSILSFVFLCIFFAAEETAATNPIVSLLQANRSRGQSSRGPSSYPAEVSVHRIYRQNTNANILVSLLFFGRSNTPNTPGATATGAAAETAAEAETAARETDSKWITMLRLYGPGRRKNSEGSGSSKEADGAQAGGGSVSGIPRISPPSGVDANCGAPATSAACGPRLLPSEIRLQKDLEEMDLPPNCTLYAIPAGTSWAGPAATGRDPSVSGDLVEQGNFQNFFLLTLVPDEGYWKQGRIRFEIKLQENYPHEPPKVKCKDKIYHPNIDLQGNVCLNILREDWKPVLSLSSVIYGILHLFLEPNPNDPLNQEAAATLRNEPNVFAQRVRSSMRGFSLGGVVFSPIL